MVIILVVDICSLYTFPTNTKWVFLNIMFLVEQDMKLALYFKDKQEHSSVDAAQSPANSARHALPPSSAVATPSCTAGKDSNLLSFCFEIFIYLVPILPFALA